MKYLLEWWMLDDSDWHPMETRAEADEFVARETEHLAENHDDLRDGGEACFVISAVTDDEYDTLRAWCDHGIMEGDPDICPLWGKNPTVTPIRLWAKAIRMNPLAWNQRTDSEEWITTSYVLT